MANGFMPLNFGMQYDPTQMTNQYNQMVNPAVAQQNPMTGFNFNTPQTPQTGGMFSAGSMFGTQQQPGWLSQGIGAASGIANAWLGMEQLDLAKKNLAFQQDAFNKNYQNQMQLTNQQLMDRQRARYASNPTAYANPDDQWQSANLLGK